VYFQKTECTYTLLCLVHSFIKNTGGQSTASNFDLLAIGGDSINSQWIHNSLELLNVKLFFQIEMIYKNKFI
jgi:hypothetical protein